MVEQKKERLAIHFSLTNIDEMIGFYSDLLSFECVKDTHLGGGGRWAAVAKDDNHGAQIHFHEEAEKSSGHMSAPICIEFSHPDISELCKHLKAKGVSYEVWDCPWACGVFLNDPFGNRLNISEYF